MSSLYVLVCVSLYGANCVEETHKMTSTAIGLGEDRIWELPSVSISIYSLQEHNRATLSLNFSRILHMKQWTLLNSARLIQSAILTKRHFGRYRIFMKCNSPYITAKLPLTKPLLVG